ncbi:hypothetical protein ANCCAN_02941 [Ancylostoma caninum]|uniref:ZIG1/7 N-terminal domain-containing protein n=1 Tax=Ancylostoma caninum TaxID=29170 RepID=A0A368H5A6_ANCCA|nr:hypothetical protein ANCCAN_02941 [Ancylostoma caninum]
MKIRVFDRDQLASDELTCPHQTAINQLGGPLIELRQHFLPADVSIAFTILRNVSAHVLPTLSYVRVVGNLAIVARPIGHVGTDASPVQSNVGEFWCGIEKVGEEIPVEYGEFTRVRDGKVQF